MHRTFYRTRTLRIFICHIDGAISGSDDRQLLVRAMGDTVFTVEELLMEIAHGITDFRSVLRLSATSKGARAAVCRSGVLDEWAAKLTRLPELVTEDPMAVMRHVHGGPLLSALLGMKWCQRTYQDEIVPEPRCTFSFDVQLGAVPGPLHLPPLPLEVQDTCDDPAGPAQGFEGTGTFAPQHGWGSPIPFQVTGWLRGVHLCYRIEWAVGYGGSVMRFVLSSTAEEFGGIQGREAISGCYSNYEETEDGPRLRPGDESGICTLELQQKA